MGTEFTWRIGNRIHSELQQSAINRCCERHHIHCCWSIPQHSTIQYPPLFKLNNNIGCVESGDIFSWGYNEEGQTGLGHMNSPQTQPAKLEKFAAEEVIEVYAGYHSMALTSISSSHTN